MSDAVQTQLDQLKQFTRVVADSGDFGTLKQFAPQDATTNPSLILKAAQMPEYKFILDKAIADNKSKATGKELVGLVMDDMLILFGMEILKIVPGRVSTETDANLSFDTAVERSRLGIGANRGIEGEALRAVLVQYPCHGQRIVDIHLAKRQVRTRLPHGGAQGANAGIHIPPGGIFGERVEIDQGVLQARLGMQWLTGKRYQLFHPAVGERLTQNRLAHQAGRAHK